MSNTLNTLTTGGVLGKEAKIDSHTLPDTLSHYEDVLMFRMYPRIYLIAFMSTYVKRLRYLEPLALFLGLKPPSGISCHWQVVREQIKTFVSVKQLFASVEGQPKLVNLG